MKKNTKTPAVDNATAKKTCECGNIIEADGFACFACMEDLNNRVSVNEMFGAPQSYGAVLRQHAKNKGIGPAGKCAICDGNYIFGGHNPAPVIDDEDARCCTACNYTTVLQARLSLDRLQEAQTQQQS